MGDLLQEATQWLGGMLKTHVSRPVTYLRGLASAVVSATRGRSVFELTDDFNQTIRVETADFLIDTADLVLDDERTLPNSGDRIEESQEDQVFVFEVMAPGGGEPPYRYSDPYRNKLRIHTKHVDTRDV